MPKKFVCQMYSSSRHSLVSFKGLVVEFSGRIAQFIEQSSPSVSVSVSEHVASKAT